MYDLFELKKILTLVKPSGQSGVTIQLSAYSEYSGRSTLALVCDNGYLLFYYLNGSETQPVIRQLGWFCEHGKQIRALSFDPSGTWLLLVTFDASVYILPVLPLLDPTVRFPYHWKTDNITEIKLSGQRAPLTSVRWWQTLQGQHIAVISSELGEIAFVNLINKKEIGGTYITVGISALDILKDESHDTTYLLITGNNRQQWRLLLEEKKSNFYWPFNSEVEVISCDSGSGLTSSEKDEKDGEQKPHKLSKFESGTFLTPQSGIKRNLVSAYNSSSSILQVLEGDLNQMHLFSYQVPAECENVVLSDKLIFITQTQLMSNEKWQSCLKLLSRKFAEISSENSKKKEQQNAEMQVFFFQDKVNAVYKRSFDCCRRVNFQNATSVSLENSSSSDLKDMMSSSLFSNFNNSDLNKLPSENRSGSNNLNYESDSDQDDGSASRKFFGSDFLSHVSSLDGCYVVLKDTVWECRLRIPPEILFLSSTSTPADLPFAEKLGVMLGLEIHKLYEIAAEMQLSNGQFAQAVHLYQLSKCPQLKRIAHFMSYGYLSELIAYIQVLFSTKSVEIVSADKCHFANIALHCFAQQAMEKVNEWWAISNAFKKFLRDNVYYDEAVAIKLFAEQGLFDLLHYFSKVRGQHGVIVDTLLQTDGLCEAVDADSFQALLSAGFNNLATHSNYEDYILCMTSSNLLQYLAANPSLLSSHIQHLIELLPNMNTFQLTKIASLFDLSRGLTRLAIRNIASTKQRHRYWSTGSVTMIPNDGVDLNKNDKELANEEDLIKFFIFVLLMLCWNSKNHFKVDLISWDSPSPDEKEPAQLSDTEPAKCTTLMPISCGQAHVAFCHNGVLYTWGKAADGRLGNGDVIIDFESPSPVCFLLKLRVKVLSVSCGAAHSIALTDFGVFSWGSSRYGQLGLGNIQRTGKPVAIESLMNQNIIAVECGQYHTLALSKNGWVYSWGWGVHGQLGHGNPEDANTPKVIGNIKAKTIVYLAAGQGHSVLLTKSGEVFTFGCGMFGQLGIGSVLKHSLPQLVPLPEVITLISSGHFHCVAVSKNNNIYTWGCNPQALRLQAQSSRRARQNNSISQGNFSQSSSNSSGTRAIHPSSPMQTHLLPILIDSTAISNPVSHISCGSHHTVILTTSGEIFSWGRNMDGQIGNGSRKEQKIPSVIAHLSSHKIMFASCGADFTVAMDSAGNVLGWGKNDWGQVGQKPADVPAKVASSSSSGRVITIRTNRRMITITQPCRQSFLSPVEIIIPSFDFHSDFDSGSFENDHLSASFQRGIYDGAAQNLKELSSYDNPPYGPYALHAVLKAFHTFCDSTILLKHCQSFSNFQAAAKVCILRNQYAKALEYQLLAIKHDPTITSEEYLPLALYVIDFYSNFIVADSTECNMKFLSQMMKFWIDHHLPVQPLEMHFQQKFHLYSYALCLLLFKSGPHDSNSVIKDKFLNQLSNKFCLCIITATINRIQKDNSHFEILENMMDISNTTSSFGHIHGADALTAWNDSVPSERLWQEILHNIQKGITNHCALYLGASEVDILAKSLIAERLCNYQPYSPSYTMKNSKTSENNNDTIAFSCNHHYTLQNFYSTVVPTFKEAVIRLPLYIPSTLNHLLNCYQLEGFIPSACPKCVLNEIKGEIG